VVAPDPQSFRFNWDDDSVLQAVCSGTCESFDDAAGSFSAPRYFLLGAVNDLASTSLGARVNPSAGLSCTATARVRGAGAFDSVNVRVEVLVVPGLDDALVIGAPRGITFDSDWTAVSATFEADGSELVARLVLVGQAGGANVLVDDLDVDCR
jgi:hypothetical protein